MVRPLRQHRAQQLPTMDTGTNSVSSVVHAIQNKAKDSFNSKDIYLPKWKHQTLPSCFSKTVSNSVLILTNSYFKYFENDRAASEPPEEDFTTPDPEPPATPNPTTPDYAPNSAWDGTASTDGVTISNPTTTADVTAIDGSALDGATSTDGPAGDNPALNGATTDVTAPDGPALDGDTTDGSALDGPAISSTTGAINDDPAADGTTVNTDVLGVKRKAMEDLEITEEKRTRI
ncbi:hypothetical protein BC833DRAFT_567408 [Globomyces pollinis-pini]|nr:hypothetical protein BC833DRAFT_567408 [Globomyces pollinis-pini]